MSTEWKEASAFIQWLPLPSLVSEALLQALTTSHFMLYMNVVKLDCLSAKKTLRQKVGNWVAHIWDGRQPVQNEPSSSCLVKSYIERGDRMWEPKVSATTGNTNDLSWQGLLETKWYFCHIYDVISIKSY